MNGREHGSAAGNGAPPACGVAESRRAATLVKLLALAPGHRLHREKALDLLWPDLDARAASNGLRRALYVARRALEAVGR